MRSILVATFLILFSVSCVEGPKSSPSQIHQDSPELVLSTPQESQIVLTTDDSRTRFKLVVSNNSDKAYQFEWSLKNLKTNTSHIIGSQDFVDITPTLRSVGEYELIGKLKEFITGREIGSRYWYVTIKPASEFAALYPSTSVVRSYINGSTLRNYTVSFTKGDNVVVKFYHDAYYVKNGEKVKDEFLVNTDSLNSMKPTAVISDYVLNLQNIAPYSDFNKSHYIRAEAMQCDDYGYCLSIGTYEWPFTVQERTSEVIPKIKFTNTDFLDAQNIVLEEDKVNSFAVEFVKGDVNTANLRYEVFDYDLNKWIKVTSSENIMGNPLANCYDQNGVTSCPIVFPSVNKNGAYAKPVDPLKQYKVRAYAVNKIHDTLESNVLTWNIKTRERQTREILSLMNVSNAPHEGTFEGFVEFNVTDNEAEKYLVKVLRDGKPLKLDNSENTELLIDATKSRYNLVSLQDQRKVFFYLPYDVVPRNELSANLSLVLEITKIPTTPIKGDFEQTIRSSFIVKDVASVIPDPVLENFGTVPTSITTGYQLSLNPGTFKQGAGSNYTENYPVYYRWSVAKATSSNYKLIDQEVGSFTLEHGQTYNQEAVLRWTPPQILDGTQMTLKLEWSDDSLFANGNVKHHSWTLQAKSNVTQYSSVNSNIFATFEDVKVVAGGTNFTVQIGNGQKKTYNITSPATRSITELIVTKNSNGKVFVAARVREAVTNNEFINLFQISELNTFEKELELDNFTRNLGSIQAYADNVYVTYIEAHERQVGIIKIHEGFDVIKEVFVRQMGVNGHHVHAVINPQSPSYMVFTVKDDNGIVKIYNANIKDLDALTTLKAPIDLITGDLFGSHGIEEIVVDDVVVKATKNRMYIMARNLKDKSLALATYELQDVPNIPVVAEYLDYHLENVRSFDFVQGPTIGDLVIIYQKHQATNQLFVAKYFSQTREWKHSYNVTPSEKNIENLPVVIESCDEHTLQALYNQKAGVQRVIVNLDETEIKSNLEDQAGWHPGFFTK